MKRRGHILALAMVLAMGIGTLTGCGSKDTGSSGDTSSAKETESETVDTSSLKLMSDGVLSVGCEVGYPPFEDFAEDGTTPVGYDVDIISEVASRLGLKVNIINTAWDGIFAGLGQNYDVVCSACTITDERLKTMDFSTPYINNYQSVVLPTGSDLKINSFKDLDGMTVAVQKETTSDILMSDYKETGTIDVEIVANEKVPSCFTQLTNGEIDAICVDSTVADGYVASDPDKYTMAYKDEKEAEQFGIAIVKGNTALQDAINKVLADMEADGFIKDTYDYWFGAGETKEE